MGKRCMGMGCIGKGYIRGGGVWEMGMGMGCMRKGYMGKGVVDDTNKRDNEDVQVLVSFCKGP